MVKTVDKNSRDTVVELDGGECEVVFSAKYSAFALMNNGASDVLMSIYAGKTTADDGVRIVGSGESAVIAAPMLSEKLYVTGAGRVQIAALMGLTNPFKPAAKGGGGGGGEPNKINSISVNGTILSPDINKNVEIGVPVKVSELENDSEYQTADQVQTAILDEPGSASTDSASSAHTIENAVDYPLIDLKMYGKSTQGYAKTGGSPCGKNLFDSLSISPRTKTENGVTFTVEDDGGITITGSKTDITQGTPFAKEYSTEKARKAITSAGKYTLSGGSAQGQFAVLNVFSNGTTRYNVCTSSSPATQTGTITQEEIDAPDFKFIIGIWSPSNNDFTEGTYYIQFEKGDTATEYEPYKGTPNPDNPVNIVSVGDSGAVNVTACGKNLFDAGLLPRTKTENGVTFTVEDDGGITVSGSKMDIAKAQYLDKSYTTEETRKVIASAGKYTLSGVNELGLGLEIYLNVFSNGTWRHNACNSTREQTGTITQEEIDAPDFKITIGIWSSENKDFTEGTYYIQLEKGDTVTEYEPYKAINAKLTSALPLCSVGDVRDELIYNADGTAKIIKRTGKYTVDGTEKNYRTFPESKEISIDDDKFQTILEPLSPYVGNVFKCKSTMFVADSAGHIWNGVNDNAIGFNDTLRIFSSKFSTAEDAQTFFTSNPMVFYALLKAPQEISLTAEETAALKALQTFNGTTNVSNDCDAEMDVKYCTSRMLSECVFPFIKSTMKG